MTTPGGAQPVNPELTAAWIERFGDQVTVTESFAELTVEVPTAIWTEALEFARDQLSCGFFDWLTGVDELAEGFGIVAHVYSLEHGHHLLVRTRVPRDDPRLPTASGAYRGANWHERETHEMFGVIFDGHPGLTPLLLPDGFEGHPLRKEFVLAARVAKPWPGAKEPGESGHGAPSRRRVRPPGVPDDWGPQATAGGAAEDSGDGTAAGRGRRAAPDGAAGAPPRRRRSTADAGKDAPAAAQDAPAAGRGPEDAAGGRKGASAAAEGGPAAERGPGDAAGGGKGASAAAEGGPAVERGPEDAAGGGRRAAGGRRDAAGGAGEGADAGRGGAAGAGGGGGAGSEGGGGGAAVSPEEGGDA